MLSLNVRVVTVYFIEYLHIICCYAMAISMELVPSFAAITVANLLGEHPIGL